MRASPAALLPSFEWTSQRFSTAVSQVIVLARQSPDRVGITFVLGTPIGVVGALAWRIQPQGTPADGIGFLLNEANPTLTMTFADYGPLIGQEWRGIPIYSGPPVSTAVNVYQFTFDPTRNLGV